MRETTWKVTPAADAPAAWDDVVAVCRRVPPLWDLRNWVAVNPFLGFAATPIDRAARQVEAGLEARVLPGLDFYRRRWADGAFGPGELPAGPARDLVEGTAPCPARHVFAPATFAERHDAAHGTDWVAAIRMSVARWCAVHASGGGTYWPLPEGQPLYASWLEAARVDPNLEIAGLAGWRGWARRLPGRPQDAVPHLLRVVAVPAEQRSAYLYRLLGGLYGWASYFRRAAWQGGGDGPGEAADLLAILLATDAAVAELGRPVPAGPALVRVEDAAVRLALQDALEDGYVRRLAANFAAPAEAATRPDVQAVFCIDVRSEPLRRHLEAASAGVETRGFAGFFGVALDHGGSARCPVLLKPTVPLPAGPTGDGEVAAGLRHVQSAAAASFTFVEVAGLAYGAALAGDAVGATGPARGTDGRGGFALPADIDLAEGILRGMAFTETFARLVLLCGHEGRSANNPHAAGLDCGACGGHGGALNARVAAALLNAPAVRVGLAARGWRVPADTHFLAGVHETATDAVELLDLDRLPASHAGDVARLRGLLATAGAGVRRERAAALGLGDLPDAALERALDRRGRDAAEVRPEWGLARNAAFVAARRCRTRGADLAGRVFLHEYDAAADPDDAVLTLILTAPVVVASWINLQYFAATVDNAAFGAGTKALHNRVGDVGVVLGNGGDLRPGLPAQSVHGPDGAWFHEPLRLQVVVEAATDRIDAVLAGHPAIGDLVANGWVRLFALAPDGAGLTRRRPGGGWEAVA